MQAANAAAATEESPPPALFNDEGLEMMTYEECHYSGSAVFYCNRRLRRRHGNSTTRECSPASSWQCDSCARFQASMRLSLMEERFPSLQPLTLITALRQARGSTRGATDILRKFFDDNEVVHPEEALVKQMMEQQILLPRGMIETALMSNHLDLEQTQEWLQESCNIEHCFDLAAKAFLAKRRLNNNDNKEKQLVIMPACTTFLNETCKVYKKNDSTEIQRGHYMVPIVCGQYKTCVLCASKLPSPEGGYRQCRHCLLCEACISTLVVDSSSCPSLANGSCKHRHPLHLSLQRSECACDLHVSKKCCHDQEDDETRAMWSCLQCDYDVCPWCMEEPLVLKSNQRQVEETAQEKEEDEVEQDEESMQSVEDEAAEEEQSDSEMDVSVSGDVDRYLNAAPPMEEEEEVTDSVDTTILQNDEGVVVTAAMNDSVGIEMYYCGRHVRNPRDNIRVFCNGEYEQQCPSCARFQGSFRLQTLREQFVGLEDETLVAALRLCGGDVDGATACLVEKGAVLNYDSPTSINKVMTLLSFPRAMAKAAIQLKRTVNVATLGEWLTEPNNMQACFEKAVQNEYEHTNAEEKHAHPSTPTAIVELGKTCTKFSTNDTDKARMICRNGHCMVLANKESQTCVLCACPLPSILGGTRQCQACLLCEGCIIADMVRTCPALANGGELHSHPLTFMLDRSWCVCDIEGDDCVRDENKEPSETVKSLWSCSECDFDVCMSCISHPVPENYNRALRRRVDEVEEEVSDNESLQEGDSCDSDNDSQMEDFSSDDDDEDSEEESEEEDSDDDDDDDSDGAFPTFDASIAESQAAAQWDNAVRPNSKIDVLLGTGRVGTTAPVRTVTNKSDDEDEGDLIPLAGTQLSSQATRALSLFRHRKHVETVGEEETQSDSRTVAAVDVTLVEDILQQAETIKDKRARRRLHQAVAAGRIDLAGTLLVAHLYSSSNNVTDNEVKRCWCGDAIHAPDGPVGCLKGHFMHASCAADLLLGGGVCPTCRGLIFYSSIPSAETRAAADFVKEEALRAQREEEEKARRELQELALTHGALTLNVGDIVCISPDKELCSQVQRGDPIAGGWNQDMLGLCGSKGSITELVQDDGKTIAVRVRPIRTSRPTHTLSRNDDFVCEECDMYGPSPETGERVCSNCRHCENCCGRPRYRTCSRRTIDWLWNSTLVKLVRRAGSSVLEGENVDEDQEGTVAVMKSVTQHMSRLRSELVAVKAARERVKTETDAANANGGPLVLEREFSDKTSTVIRDVASSLTPADLLRARHLLTLAMEWGDDEHAKDMREFLHDDIRAGHLDTVARKIRRENAARTVEASRWADAANETGQYTVKSFAKVDLLAFPRSNAPKTGYSLEPESRFQSKREILDGTGVTWVQVAEGAERFGEKVEADAKNLGTLIGARVRRGKDWGWENGDEDGGEGTDGTIIKAHADKTVIVRWDGVGGLVKKYRAGADGFYHLSFSSTPPPQGWLCVHPRGLGAPSVVARTNSALCCCGCGNELEPSDISRDKFDSTKGIALRKGDRVVVAATLVPVVVESIDEGRIRCSFLENVVESQGSQKSNAFEDNGGPRNYVSGRSFFEAKGKREGENRNNAIEYFDDAGKESSISSDVNSVWYRPEDLVRLNAAVCASEEGEERRMLGARARTRREFLLFFDRDEVAAQKAWEDAEPLMEHCRKSSFASCLRGHLLHSRCLQGALLTGSCCPEFSCSEPLWVPGVRRLQNTSSADNECETNRTAVAEEEILRAATDLTEHSAIVAARAVEAVQSNGDEADLMGWNELKMCPACCAGPLYNENCSDMRRHHGECTALLLQRESGTASEPCTPNGIFRVKPSDIAKRLTQLSGTKSVADLLPRCATHNSLVMFNGCMACGYIFADIDWYDLPGWDPFAKDRLELDRKKMNAARLLAEQVRQEAALLQFERDALLSLE